MKQRLDKILFSKGIVRSRSHATDLIRRGLIRVDGNIATKAGMIVDDKNIISLTKAVSYVGRGGEKLEYAIDKFKIDFKNKTVIDVGSSTGGFTEVAIRSGARTVYAIDVGKNQLDRSLRDDPRVIVMEETDIRNLSIRKRFGLSSDPKAEPFLSPKAGSFPPLFEVQPLGLGKVEPPLFPKAGPLGLPKGPALSFLNESADIVLIDVSFISLKEILSKIYSLLKKNGDAIVLVKPQFESGMRGTKKGIVKIDEDRSDALQKVRQYAIESGFLVAGETDSPITGKKGNHEYFLHLKRS